MIMQSAFDNFIRSRRILGLAEKTIMNYTQFVTPFILFVGADSDISVINKDLTYSYIEHLHTKKISKATVATHIRHIKAFLNWIEEEFEISVSAEKIKVPRTPKKVIHIYSDDEIKLIFEIVTAKEEWIVARNRCIIALMFDSGLRQNEVCTLLRRDVSYASNTIKICGKGNKERVVPFGEISRHFMTEYDKLCPYQEDTFFVGLHGGAMTCDSVKHMMFKLGKLVPFPLSSHKLRHNFATNYCITQLETRGQVDIFSLMYLMGHEELETTKRYLHFAHQIIAARNNISKLDLVMNTG